MNPMVSDLQWRSVTICVTPMIDIKNMNLVKLVVDAIADTILTAPGAPHAFERSVQRRADTMRFSTVVGRG